MSAELIGHVSRDSTAIIVWEKPAKSTKKPKVAKRRESPDKGEKRPPDEPKRIEAQRSQSVSEAIALLPNVCDRGIKKNAKGNMESWNGFKLHLDVNDFGTPLSAVLTSAFLHDSQVVISLMKPKDGQVTYCYDLMDAAYDAAQIWKQSRELDHVPIIDQTPRVKEVIPMTPHEAVRYNERTSIARCNGRLKDEFGGRDVQVRGHDKVKMPLMFGIIALFADQLLKVTGC